MVSRLKTAIFLTVLALFCTIQVSVAQRYNLAVSVGDWAGYTVKRATDFSIYNGMDEREEELPWYIKNWPILAIAASAIVILSLLYTKSRKKPPIAPTELVSEEERLRRLIEQLDQRLIEGKISEETYRKLKEEYVQKLERIERQWQNEVN